MYPVCRNGTVVGFATHDGGVLVGPLVSVSPDDPERRFALAMLRYGNAVAAGELHEPYSDDRAELFARTLLMKDAAFRGLARERDDVLARRFNVPIDQIRLKRDDIATPSRRAPFVVDRPSR